MTSPLIPVPGPVELSMEFTTDDMVYRATMRHVGSYIDPNAIFASTAEENFREWSYIQDVLNGWRGPSSDAGIK